MNALNVRLLFLFVSSFVSDVSSFSSYRPSQFANVQRRNGRLVSQLAAAQVDASLYDGFVPGESKELAVKDEMIGDGEEAREGCMLTVSFKGRTMFTNVEQDVDKFSFKLGEEGAVMEGWQQGLSGMKVGGKRCLRIPAGELARGPPGEDLEFEVELTSVSEGAFNEFLIKNGFGANTKTYGIIVLIVISAILPQLEKAGILSGQGLLGF
uniref:peptidylprolyl isomerase n=1 Tax=Odontella aurita TaxID=265563 RepID=A0A7S4IP83_9STRA|mmetsp:Transcript_281/g.793  ORF Transcript_281/g.793 Transcript_281/m.793 type:complete len:210 (+) Transcript_281:182-811(+)